MQMMKKPQSLHKEDCDCELCMARGGQIGVHGSFGKEGESFPGFKAREASDSLAPGGHKSRENLRESAKNDHREILAEGRSINPKLKGLAHGGEIEPDEELHEGVGHEIMDAFHSKDHKKLMSGLEAMILHHMNKKED